MDLARSVDDVLRLPPDNAEADCFIYSSLLQRLGRSSSLEGGRRIHRHLATAGQDRCNTFLGNHLINMYGKCGSIDDARRVFEGILRPNVFSWNTMIAAYTQNGHFDEARRVFGEMPRKNVVSWNTLLAAYSERGMLCEAKEMFDRMPQKDVISWNSLVTAYAQNGHILVARGLFENMPTRDAASWNTMIAAYAHAKHGSEEALTLFKRLIASPVRPDDITFLSVIEACSDLENGHFIHSSFINAKVRSPLKVENALINLYGSKFQRVAAAREIFDTMRERDLISWNTMIAAYAQSGDGEEGIHLFRIMDLYGEAPDSITLIAVLDACTAARSLERGKTIHAAIRAGTRLDLTTHLLVLTALVNMYGNLGCVELAMEAFQGIQRRDVTAWTAVIVAHARNGHGGAALELFREFGLEGMQPDAVAFLSILTACSHAGLLYSGRDFFVALHGDYNVGVTLEHYRCVIDMLGRLGQLELAEEVIRGMPFKADFVSWVTLLGACKTQGDAHRGQRVAEAASSLDPGVASPYVYRYYGS
ncbi:pentatricopeptide repeat-containing protein At4g02750 [Selaginella moellendorffii]|uniref:pentatricopeptide repeat-containing protein At4g02750 n=1 Tax=Selaginella moellendorffii TaxID=88036 RepID=UPI000D1CF49C|nr:pentatricopeptide repeat-containing protein At4g02750 [Selaginella moellendorffii]|eukprot:XP_024521131.1 pentatricopeptide repeat-containing protein At4g02750 [Selaginella moellendorffii]